MKTPGSWTMAGLFEGRPGSFRLLEIVREYIESLGPVKIEVSKTQVSFGSVTKFAWVWLPQKWIKKRAENSITLTFDSGHRIEDERIAEAVAPRPGRWTHHVVLDKESDFDDAVQGWLRDAYEFGQTRHKSKKS